MLEAMPGPVVSAGAVGVAGAYFRFAELVVIAYGVVVSILCFVAYAVDKGRAKGDRRRVSERALLLLGLVGGWPGAILAQRWLRHKTRKPAFRRAFWTTVVLNILLALGLLSVVASS